VAEGPSQSVSVEYRVRHLESRSAPVYALVPRGRL
jgi:hypothetical protein